jgi:hypothetical protein
MKLAEHQRAMRDLIAGRAIANDPYIEQASRSIGLDVTRDTIRGWRVFRLGQSCRLTTAILRARGSFDEALDATECTSPFIEELSRAFLESAIALDHELIATVARFELALMGDEETIVDWPCDPYEVLAALLSGTDTPVCAGSPHRTVVSRAMPGRFRVI